MPTPNLDALHFLQTRRSRPAKTLKAPAPERAVIQQLLTAAARTPDHGKLEPWRFIVLEHGALDRVAAACTARGAELALDDAAIEKAARAFSDSPLAVVVVAAPKPSAKVPRIEQLYSAGAVCLSLLNAALASGWGANWLSGWASHDRTIVETALNLGRDEQVAGIIHIGSESATPPERPRPDMAQITEWMSE